LNIGCIRLLESKPGMIQEVVDIGCAPGGEVIHDGYDGALSEKRVSQM
jgi:hypothetical protein